MTAHDATKDAIQGALNEWAINYRPRGRAGGDSSPREMGEALKAIRDQRLHRESFADFYVYCARRWGMRPEQVDRYIAIAEGAPPVAPAREQVEESAGRYVYFIAGGGLIKIGVANDVRARFNSIRTMSPAPLTLLGFTSGSVALERELHERFSQHRQHGEWFTDCQEIRDYLAEVLS